MSVHAQSNGALEPSVAATFDVLAWEIELAGARCMALDGLIAELMHVLPAEQRERLAEGVQSVDLLAQHLTNLSAFTRHMSANAPGGTSVPVSEALAGITLSALADRMYTALGGEEDVPVVTEPNADAGELDLF